MTGGVSVPCEEPPPGVGNDYRCYLACVWLVVGFFLYALFMNNYSLKSETFSGETVLSSAFWPQPCVVSTSATPLDMPYLIAKNTAFAQRFAYDNHDDAWWVSWLNGQPENKHPSYATVYAGHQFGHYVTQLGDGRALGWGFLKDREGVHWECQTKGSGMTPFSRMGDGRAVLRSSIREYLCSEHMHGLGIPSTRAMALMGSTTKVRRETWETAAVLLRLAPSFVRFGTFEYLANTGQTEAMDALIANVLRIHGGESSISEWFLSVCRDTGKLCAEWQAVGFCHGVLNTDNMSVHSVTLDYGPFGFIETYDPGYVCNHSDDTGRYAYWAQPEIVEWNLFQLGRALSRYFSDDTIREGLHHYNAVFSNHYLKKMSRKLGLPETQVTWPFMRHFITMMTQSGMDYTRFFRYLGREFDDREWVEKEALSPGALKTWLEQYDAQGPRSAATLADMAQVNPAYILRNWVAQWVIEKAEAGNTSLVQQVCDVLRRPYMAHPCWEHLQASAPSQYSSLSVSCSS